MKRRLITGSYWFVGSGWARSFVERSLEQTLRELVVDGRGGIGARSRPGVHPDGIGAKNLAANP